MLFTSVNELIRILLGRRSKNMGLSNVLAVKHCKVVLLKNTTFLMLKCWWNDYLVVKIKMASW